MITALVKYKIWLEAPHPLLNDTYTTTSKVVEVEKATDLNGMFENIVDIKIL